MPRDQPTISNLGLHKLVSKSVKRQHMLGSVPPALQFIPLGAILALDIYDRKSGKDAINNSLMDLQAEKVLVVPPEANTTDLQPLAPRRLWSCGFCNSFPQRPHVEHNINALTSTKVVNGAGEMSPAKAPVLFPNLAQSSMARFPKQQNMPRPDP